MVVSHETVRQWALKFSQGFANQIRRRLPRAGDKRHSDEVAVQISGVQHWLWRAVDQDGFMLNIPVQSRHDKRAAKRPLGGSDPDGSARLRAKRPPVSIQRAVSRSPISRSVAG